MEETQIYRLVFEQPVYLLFSMMTGQSTDPENANESCWHWLQLGMARLGVSEDENDPFGTAEATRKKTPLVERRFSITWLS